MKNKRKKNTRAPQQGFVDLGDLNLTKEDEGKWVIYSIRPRLLGKGKTLREAKRVAGEESLARPGTMVIRVPRGAVQNK